MRLFLEVFNIPLSGWLAVHILHYVDKPSYLVLTIGWVALVSALASVGTVINAMSSRGPCVCAVCSNHRQQLGCSS